MGNDTGMQDLAELESLNQFAQSAPDDISDTGDIGDINDIGLVLDSTIVPDDTVTQEDIQTIRPKRKAGGNRSTLRTKQKIFIERYLTHWNGAQAARDAGYTKNSNATATALLSNPRVTLAIQARLNQLQVSANETLTRLSAIARGSMEYFYNFDSEQIDLQMQSARDNFGLIKKMKQTSTTKTTKDGDTTVINQVELELYDKQAALVVLLKYHRLLDGDNVQGATVNNTLIVNGDISREFLTANNIDALDLARELEQVAREISIGDDTQLNGAQ